jgi:hypothetical protein
MKKINNIIVISDEHFGCEMGLFPFDKFLMDGGGYYYPSPLQKKVAKMWRIFWDEWVPEVTKGEPYFIVNNGDAVDGTHHGSVTQITQNLERQKEMAIVGLMPLIKNKKCAGYYHIRGTEAHVGKSGQYEEEIAKQLGARPDETGNHARWEMWFNLNGKLIHFSHHIGTTGSSAYESTAVYKECVEQFVEAGRWGDAPPDVVVRSHRHRQFETRIATKNGYGISLVTPGWQLKTPFVHKLPGGRASTPQMGGYLIRTGDEDSIYTRFKVFRIERSKVENYEK